MKIQYTFWNKDKRQNDTGTVEVVESTLVDVRSRMRNTNPTDREVVEFMCDEMRRRMGGRKINTVTIVE